MTGSVKFHEYNGEKAVTLAFGQYSAMILPDAGGNLVSFVDEERHLDFLRTPKEAQMSTFKSRPFVFGIPVLFPQNRYEDGTFTWDGRQYLFPVNEKTTNNHLHGFLHNVPWKIDDFGACDEFTDVVVSQEVDDANPIYPFWPHHFRMTIRYSLSQKGLQQEVKVDNLGPDRMPVLLAFHTTFNVPFSNESNLNDYTYKTTIGDRWELSERMLPTGSFQDLSHEEQQLQEGGIEPFFTPMDNHYTSVPQNGMNYMALTDHRLGLRLVYDVGTKYKQWMIWNNFGNGNFFCTEPQTNIVNAPNLHLSGEDSGMIVLDAGHSWSETSRFFVDEI